MILVIQSLDENELNNKVSSKIFEYEKILKHTTRVGLQSNFLLPIHFGLWQDITSLTIKVMNQ